MNIFEFKLSICVLNSAHALVLSLSEVLQTENRDFTEYYRIRSTNATTDELEHG